jgi:Cohesin domain
MRSESAVRVFYCLLVVTISICLLYGNAEAGSAWLLIGNPQPAPVSGGTFTTDVYATTWDTVIGAYTVTVSYDPSILNIVQVTAPSQSEFYGNLFSDSGSFMSGTTDVAGLQVSPCEADHASLLATIEWKVVGQSATDTTISLTSKSMVDSSWRPVDVNNTSITSFINDPNGGSLAPVPQGQQTFTYVPALLPLLGSDPSSTMPIGVGSAAACGNSLSLRIGLPKFSGPIDAYLALYVPGIDPNNIYLLTPDLTFQTLSAGMIPWKADISGPVDEYIFSDISGLPSGLYYLGLMVTPANQADNYYFWVTSFDVP